MDQIPEIRVATATGRTYTYLGHGDKPYKTASKDEKGQSSMNEPAFNLGHSLKLKDYLRLTTITKRSSSNSIKKNKETSNTVQTPTKSPSMLDTEKSLNILKEELKSDLRSCIDKVGDLLQKVEKNGPKLEMEEDQYDELVFLCELHRMIKEGIMGSLEKANILVADHKQKQFFKFSAKAKELIGQDMKKTTTPKKRSSLYASCLRPHLLQNSHS